jgi:hypothetical protein
VEADMFAFTSAAWLVGLVPLAVLTIYLGRAARRTAQVPFVALWGGGGVSRAAGAMRWPAAGVLLAVAAAGLAILAAAGPTWARAGRRPATVVLDRGRTMAGVGGRPFRGTVDRAAAILGDRPATLICVPPIPDGAIVGGGWRAAAAAASPTAVDTGAALDAVVHGLLRQGGDGDVLLLSDRPVQADDRRLVRVTPVEASEGVGIVSVAARERPSPQVMVRLRGPAGAVVPVHVVSGSTVVDRGATLGATDAIFIEMPGPLGDAVAVTVNPATVDGTAWLAANESASHVEATAAVPTPVRRMADVFNAAESPAATGRSIVVTTGPLPADQPGVRIVPGDGGAGPAVVTAHPVSADVRTWAGGGATVPDGFTVVVRIAGRAVVAVRDGPARQVWANPDVGAWSRSTDWVVFLANAFRWTGGGPRVFAAAGPQLLGAEWHRVDGGRPSVPAGYWPGLYESVDGERMAIDAGMPGPPVPVPTAASWPAQPIGPTPWLCAAAVAFLASAAALWPTESRAHSPIGGRNG